MGLGKIRTTLMFGKLTSFTVKEKHFFIIEQSGKQKFHIRKTRMASSIVP